MNSPLLALFARSVREDARSKGTYWTRIALGVFIILYLAVTALTGNWVGATGRNFFIGVVILQCIAISFVGLSYFASAITEEKEDATLGLLRMTNLSALAILLGKSTSRLWGALLLLAAQFPFTVVAVTMGGISLGQILAVYCTLGAYIFLLCNVALLGSVVSRHTPGAAIFTVLVVGLFLAAGPLLGWFELLLNYYGLDADLGPLGSILWNTTPIARLIDVLGTGFRGAATGIQVASNVAVGAGCFLLAWLVFDRFCDRSSTEGTAGESAGRSILGVRVGRPARPRSDALVWKDFHFLHGGRAGLIARIICYPSALIGALCLWESHPSPGFNGLHSIFTGLISFGFSIDLGAMAGRLFGSEIRDQTLSALAVLPVTIRQLAYRKARACLLAAIPGMICYVAVSLMSFAQLRNMPAAQGMQSMFVVQIISGYTYLLLLVYVVAWLSLSMKRGSLPVGYVVTNAFQALVTMLGFAIIALLSYLASKGNSAASYIAATMTSMTVAAAMSCVFSLLTSYFLHRYILHRLGVLAAEN